MVNMEIFHQLYSGKMEPMNIDILSFDVTNGWFTFLSPTDITGEGYCTFKDGRWYLGRVDDYALRIKDMSHPYMFYVDGVCCNLADLPCDNDIKVFLALKYSGEVYVL